MVVYFHSGKLQLSMLIIVVVLMILINHNRIKQVRDKNLALKVCRTLH